MSESALNSSFSESGLICQTKSIDSICSQVDFCHFDQSPSKKGEVYTEEIKTALVDVSVRAQILLEKACNAAQAFLKKIYGHSYYILYNEKHPEQASKMPITADHYADYADIFSDKKTITKYKYYQTLTTTNNCDAVKALMNKKSNESYFFILNQSPEVIDTLTDL